MNLFKRVLSLLMILVILLTVSSCKESYQDAVIYFEIPEFPSTLDPQTASADSELIIVNNIFEGLLRKNESGSIVCGIAESYTKDNLTYTFKLRPDTVWSDEEPLTAEDFVFALRRAVSPETKAPFASRLFCIKNAKEINSGKLSRDKLGVSAPDSTTLIINLAYGDENFEETLTTSVAMPCSRKVFAESEGKYGLSAEFTVSCGSYRLSKWNKESFGIRIYSNGFYTGTFKAKNSAVYITKSKDETPFERLLENSVDITFIDSSLSKTAKDNGLKLINYSNICWFLTLNSDLSQNLRKSLLLITSGDVFGNSLKSGYSVANSIFPPAVSENAGSSGMTLYDLQSAKRLFANEISKLPDEKFPSGIKLYYYDNGVIKPVITDIVGHWQNNLGAFVNIEGVDSAEKLSSELKKQTLTMAVFPVRADSSDMSEYLSKFGIPHNGGDLSAVQDNILRSNNIFPIAFQNTTLAYSSALNDVFTTPGNGYVDFSFIVKTE